MKNNIWYRNITNDIINIVKKNKNILQNKIIEKVFKLLET